MMSNWDEYSSGTDVDGLTGSVVFSTIDILNEVSFSYVTVSVQANDMGINVQLTTILVL